MIYRNAPQSEVAPFLAGRIIELLDEGHKVLWLLSGGSGGQVCIDVSKILKSHNLENLFVTMSDERYGEPGHPEENFHQLIKRGLELPGATMYRPLIIGVREDIANVFNSKLGELYKQTDYHIALLGIGSDGHTAGIKPHSYAVDSTQNVESFVGDDFERITVTPALLGQFDEVIVQAYGSEKHEIMEKLLNISAKDIDMQSFPAGIIKKIPKVTIWSDYKGGKNEDSN